MSLQDAIGADKRFPFPVGLDVARRLALDRQCVRRDAYDEAAFASLVEGNPALQRCCQRGEARLRSFPALLSDIFCLLFKLRPTLVDRTLVRPAFQVNRYLIARLAEEPYVKNLRMRTLLDEEAAATATISVAARLLRQLAASNLAEENRLFELEESIGDSGARNKGPARGHPRAAARPGARGAGEGDAPRGKTLPYDLQQRLDMAETLKSLRRFEHLIALTRELVGQLERDDPTRWRVTEVYDIGLGNELSRLLPGELLSLKAAPLKKDFLRRLLGRQLLTYRLRGRESSGTMVILVDVSHSMAGEKELASKALAIALSQVASGRGQPVSAILFGPRTAPLWQVDFQSGRPRQQELAALAEGFFGGGTDFERPISAAVDLISQRGGEGGQIIFISDGLCQVSEAWRSRLLATAARRQIQILAVLMDIEQWSDEVPTSFSDRIVRWSEVVSRIRPPGSVAHSPLAHSRPSRSRAKSRGSVYTPHL